MFVLGKEGKGYENKNLGGFECFVFIVFFLDDFFFSISLFLLSFEFFMFLWQFFRKKRKVKFFFEICIFQFVICQLLFIEFMLIMYLGCRMKDRYGFYFSEFIF